jgi:2-polyprenyl-3-methyl-5-hydroxy-6-metoxy-1,4-benzoquinol methylase
LDDKPAVAGDYNVVAALDVIEHLTPEQGRRLIHKMEGCLSSSGMLVLGTPSVYSAPYQSDFSQLSHVHCYDRDELLEVLKEHFGRVLCFSMNDEVVHTGHPKLAWYYFFLCFNAHSKGA